MDEQTWQNGLDELLKDPGTSYWLRDAIKAMLDRDPLDAYADAEVLRGIMKARMEAILGRFARKGVSLC